MYIITTHNLKIFGGEIVSALTSFPKVDLEGTKSKP